MTNMLALQRPSLLAQDTTLAQITEEVCAPLERKAGRLWWTAFLISVVVLLIGAAAVAYQLATGIGTWGLNRTVGWAFDITNFVFWIGIGHAGTLISAILFLFRQKWRTAVNRSAEAMTLFAVLCAGLFPLIHMGRPWLFFWMIPYPNERGLWVNFRSPLVWDFFAISTYFIISLVFWYVGLLPDLALVRDRACPGWRRGLFRLLSLGWTGSVHVWHRYERVYLLLAGLATPLVVSVHSIVSTDFATALLPGWHTTLFPPYFVAGAIFSGMAMVLTLMLIARRVMHWEAYITLQHIEAMCKIVLATSGLVDLSYLIEFFTAFYTGNPYEYFTYLNRLLGPRSGTYFLMVSSNVFVPQLLWWKKVRTNVLAVFLLSLVVNVGMWLERFLIIVTSLERDFLPASWSSYTPTLIEIATLLGSFGLFFTLFLLFCRFLPMIAIAEVKGALSSSSEQKQELAFQPVVPTADVSQKNRPVRRWGLWERLPRPSGSRRLFLGVFARADDLLAAAAAAQAQGLSPVDAYTPYALPGTAEVLGLPDSRLGWVCLAGGLLGAGAAFGFQFWASAVDWPLNVGGRPWNSWPAFVPVAFESLVLCAGLGVVLAFFLRSRLYPWRKTTAPLLDTTGSRFVLVLEEKDAAFEAARARQLLQHGAIYTEEREETEPAKCAGVSASRSSCRRNGVLLLILLGLVGLCELLHPDPRQPNREFLPDMAHPVAYGTYAPNPNFPDGKTLQAPVAGTLPRGQLPLPYRATPEDAQRAGLELHNPFSFEDQAARQRGAFLYAHYCAVCHGPAAKGDGPVTLRGVPPPPSLLAEKARQMKDGQIFHVLTYGQGNMASYAAQLSRQDRWCVILQVRAFQKQVKEKKGP
jgi:Ni/Fe-hydrogenase subunit HybB-like protein/mono/diheme cytochrome c family protein